MKSINLTRPTYTNSPGKISSVAKRYALKLWRLEEGQLGPRSERIQIDANTQKILGIGIPKDATPAQMQYLENAIREVNGWGGNGVTQPVEILVIPLGK